MLKCTYKKKSLSLNLFTFWCPKALYIRERKTSHYGYYSQTLLLQQGEQCLHQLPAVHSHQL